MESLILSRMSHVSQQSQSVQIYRQLLDRVDYPHGKHHQFIRVVMDGYAALKPQPDRSVHGRVFEYVIGESLAQQGISPLYYQAELHHVSLALFDWFLYHPTHPVSLSCKTKARDRWKQAAYEAMALKRVYPQATNYLITIEQLSTVDEKKLDSPSTIDHYVLATTPEFDVAMRDIASRSYCEAEKVSPIVKGRLVTLG